LVARPPEVLNQVSSSLCLSDTKKSISVQLFEQMERDLMAIEEFDREMKMMGKNKATS